MYEWRKMNGAQRADILHQRKQCKLPWHSPPHFGIGANLYHITAACYEHAPIINSPERLTTFEQQLISGLSENNTAQVFAWAILPNHYHLLLKTNLPTFGKWIARLHNTTSTQWNSEDKCRGRKVWHRYADRLIRGEVHYFRTINYIHVNPVKHRYVPDSHEWPWSSFAEYENNYGRDTLVRCWKEYPIKGYGDGWDN